MTDYFHNDLKIPHLSEEEEKELFSDYASVVLAASKPFDKEDERLLYNPLEFDTGDEDKTFEGDPPPSLEEVEKRLKVDNLNLHNASSTETMACAQARTQGALGDTIRELQQARDLSQEQLANILHIEPASISQLERGTDMYISTLRRYIEARGGRLDIIAHFPDGEVRIKQFAEIVAF